MTTPQPSWTFGFHMAMELWRVVAAVFVVSTIVMLPAQVVLWSAAGEALGHLPGDGLPNGEILLILIELLVPVWPALATAVVSGWFALWLWTVLWHAGVVRWLVFSGRRGARLSEILSRGVLHWWRWARLGLTSVVAFGLGLTAIAVVYGALQDRVAESATDLMFGLWLVSAIVLAAVVGVFFWLAGLRGAWLLGESARRSVVLAWLTGLGQTIRQPLRSVLTLVLWVLPGFAATVGPTILGWQFEMLRGTIPTTILAAVGGLITAFCLVGLFLSFAPVTGMVDEDPSDEL